MERLCNSTIPTAQHRTGEKYGIGGVKLQTVKTLFKNKIIRRQAQRK